MSAQNSFSLLYGGGGRTDPIRSSKRSTKGMNVRQEWSNSLNAGVSQPFSSMSQKPRVGAPPWTDRSPTGTTTEYLKGKMNQMVNPEQTNRKAQTRQHKQTRHRPSAEVLDPDAMVHQIFQLKKELLAQEIEKSRLVVDVRRLQQECSQLRVPTESLDNDVYNLIKNSSLVADLKRANRQLQKDVEIEKGKVGNLQSDIKYTSVTELRQQCEVYLEEVHRLRIQMQELQNGETATAPTSNSTIVYGVADTNHVRPSVQALRQLKQEIKVLKSENQELKTDLNQALDAAFKLREDLNAPPPSVGDSSTHDSLDRDELQKLVTNLEYKLAMVQVEKKNAVKQMSKKEEEQNQFVTQFGFKTAKEAKEIREKVKELQAQVKELEFERGNSVLAQAALIPQSENTRSSPLPSRRPGSANSSSTSSLKSPSPRLHRTPTITTTDENLQAVANTISTHTLPWPNQPTNDTSHTLQQQQQRQQQQQQVLAPPVVPLANKDTNLSEAGAKVEERKIKQAERKYKAFFSNHKDQIDEKITLIQKVIRGHMARTTLVEQLKSENDNTIQQHSQSTPISRSSSRSTHRKTSRSESEDAISEDISEDESDDDF